MQIYLRDRNQPLVDAWADIFKPANSFGFMDGGIDFVYSEYFGWGIGDLLREYLWQNHGGELLVGQAVVIDMRQTNPKHPDQQKRVSRTPYMISAPTMRVPSNVANTVNAYLAFVATLRIAKQHGFKSILCPGLATNVGRMPHDVCAVQMYEAYKHCEKPRFHDVLSNAHRLHYSMLNAITYRGSEFL